MTERSGTTARRAGRLQLPRDGRGIIAECGRVRGGVRRRAEGCGGVGVRRGAGSVEGAGEVRGLAGALGCSGSADEPAARLRAAVGGAGQPTLRNETMRRYGPRASCSAGVVRWAAAATTWASIRRSVAPEVLAAYFIAEGAGGRRGLAEMSLSSRTEHRRAAGFRFGGVIPPSANNFAGRRTGTNMSPTAFPMPTPGVGADPAPSGLCRSVSGHVHNASPPPSVRLTCFALVVPKGKKATWCSDGERQLAGRRRTATDSPLRGRRKRGRPPLLP